MRRIPDRRWLAILRYAQRKALKRQRRKARKARHKEAAYAEMQRRRESSLIRYLAAALKARGQLSLEEAEQPLKCPSQFSFIDAPDTALEFFRTFLNQVTSSPRRLLCDQTDCTAVDFCAASLLNCLGKDLLKNSSVRLMGRLPKDEEANRIVRATGWPRLLKLKYPGDEEFLHHELREGKRGGRSRVPRRNLEATRLTDYVNDCLRSFDVELTGEARMLLSALVSEVIDNAERHSGRKNWWVAGYMRRKEGAEVGDCHIVIFNFGRTIAQSLQQLPANAILRQNIERLVRLHRPFFHVRRRWTEENLWTLYALQQGVSRTRAEGPGDPPGIGGQGTVDMITYFHQLAGGHRGTSDATMCLISGRTYIRFDNRYAMALSDPTDPYSRKIIAFNAEMDLEVPPDDTAVYSLQRPFPGSLISIRFVLDKKYLTEISQ